MQRFILVASVLIAALLPGCGECTAVCSNTAVLTAIDSAGTVLTLQSVTENTTLLPAMGCKTNPTMSGGVTTVTSFCMRFAVDAVATNGKRFSGILDVSAGSMGPAVCGAVCRSANIIITVN